MINYELAKELKEGGFPQVYKTSKPYMDFAYDTGGELMMMHDDNDTNWWLGQGYDFRPEGKENELLVKCPTLSELIDACGDRFTSLWNMRDGWQAKYMDGVFENDSNPILIVRGSGSTPEEAVARLWISLHGKINT